MSDIELGPDDAVDSAIREVEAKVSDQRVRAQFVLIGGGTATLDVPHPFTADMFESIVVVLLQMRATSEARVESEKPIVVPRPTLVRPDGRRLT